jgi:glyoxylase-like metal-dependent hydrolase (beta-lactamase superfamily II)
MLKLSALQGNSQRLDGGAMFGNAPRAMWSDWAAPDERGRIELVCRAFLVEVGGKRILLEAGIGAFFEPALRDRYGVIEAHHVLLDSLAKFGLSDADIDAVVLSHLHFDHAGGLLAPYEAGSPPRLLFPKARFIVGKAAFERAATPHSRDRASFIRELPALLRDSGRLCVLESGEDAERALGPQFQIRTTDGHTPGLLHVLVTGAEGAAFFCSDAVPGSAWVHVPITMGYDRFPERLIEEKAEIFADLAARNAFLLFTHDPRVAAARVAQDERGRYRTRDACGDFAAWDLDLTAAPT